jgi:hypothetical protein
MWPQTFDSCGFHHHHTVRQPPTGEREETRLPVRYLQGSEHEVQEVLREFDNRQTSVEDICVLCRKEGEEKAEGFPYQTITISELELLKIIGTMGKSIPSGAEHDTIPIHIKKFNMQFREPMVNPLFKELDNIFGFNWVYQDTHAGFDRSVYMTNKAPNA